jgi:hypothetical protein
LIDDADDPARAIAALAACEAPRLFGVRHHSSACAAALPTWLDAAAPDVVAVELPADLATWIPWLTDPSAHAPLAIAAVDDRGRDLGFYPFADFSPELVAMRWARARGVPCVAIDQPTGTRDQSDPRAAPRGAPPVGRQLRARVGAVDDEDLWDQLVEARAAGADAERVRRAALLYGWAVRLDEARSGGVALRDRAREQHMRDAIDQHLAAGRRVAAVVGAFHAPALLPEPMLWSAPPPTPGPVASPVSSLITYSFDLLDSRSGYPAGIRDPRWHQRLWEALASGASVPDLVARCLVEIVRDVRAAGHAAGVPDATAAYTMALELARLRELPAPGRRELVEAVATSLAQGELRGRGRVLSRALERTLVGRQRGALAAATPRSGLGPHVAALLAGLRLPGPAAVAEDGVELRLDPLRAPIDRRRHVALARLAACGVPYGTEDSVEGVGGAVALTRRWTVRWRPATEAMLELAGVRGVTLRQAAAGAVRRERARLGEADALTPGRRIALVETAAEAGLGDVVLEELSALAGPALAEQTLDDLVTLLTVIDRIGAGHVVGLPAAGDDVPGEIDAFALPAAVDEGALVAAAVRAVEGLAGSTRADDALALLALVRRVEADAIARIGDGRLLWQLRAMADGGSPLMQGAAGALLVVVGERSAGGYGERIGAWFDAAVDAAARRDLAARLVGALTVAAPLLEAAPSFLDELAARVETAADADFLLRVPALREGFAVLSTAARARLLDTLAERLTERDPRGLDVVGADPELLAACAAADGAARAAADLIPRPDLGAALAPPPPATQAPAATTAALSPIDRWRLILGHERARLPPAARRAARALDELYGAGHGEGSRAELGAGDEPPFPTAREWSDEIEAVFGAHTIEEIAGRAAARGRPGLLLDADPGALVPSVELLEQVLALRGGLAEAHLGRLRGLVRRLVDEVARELAVRVRPALVGLSSPRPTRRRGGALHLGRTVAANLRGAHRIGERIVLVPDQLYFRSRSRRHADWRVVLAVDVSGSMEASVIHSALMAAILAAVPWLDVRFLAFSTEVIDLTARATDPLALLLEVQVGGGTDIARALRHARSLVAVPARTLVIVVSDFDEGPAVDGLLGEVRALVEAGVTALGVAALDDRGAPRYAALIAELVVGCGMPVAALSPLELARWIGARVR